MADLGKLTIRSSKGVTDARVKVLRVAELATGDPILATRLATRLSHECKKLLRSGDEVELLATLHAQAFEVSLRADGDERRMSEPVRDASPDIEALRAIMLRKDREQLAEELQLKAVELNVGQRIQMSLLPTVFPNHDQFSINAALEPAREVGGDFYDFFFLSGDRLCFCVGDVSGKGVPAAILMAVCKTLVKSRASSDTSTAGILTFVNEELAQNNEASMFVTLFLAILDLGTGKLQITNAGHNPPYLLRSSALTVLSSVHGPPVGAMEGMTYDEAAIDLEEGDLLFLYTDGLTEAMNDDKEFFGEPRLEAWVSRQGTVGVTSIVRNAAEQVRAFEAGAPRADDLTLMALRYERRSVSMERRLDVAVQLDELERVNEWIREFAEDTNVDAGSLHKLLIAIDELLNNIISYSGAEEPIELVVSRTTTDLSLMISDDGTPFNPIEQDAPDLAAPLESRPIGGLGIHLVKELMDESSYHREINRNVVSLRLHAPGGPGR